MLVFPQMGPTNFFIGKFDPRGPPTFKMETKQQEPREEEIPVWAMATLKISRKRLPWGQIKTLINQVKNLISQQGMPQNPENLLTAMLCRPA